MSGDTFDFEKFSDDFVYATDKIKEIIDINAKHIKDEAKEDKETDYQYNVQNACQSLVNLYLISSKIYENLSKVNNSKPKETDNKDNKSSFNKSKLDKLFDEK